MKKIINCEIFYVVLSWLIAFMFYLIFSLLFWLQHNITDIHNNINNINKSITTIQKDYAESNNKIWNIEHYLKVNEVDIIEY